MQLFLLIAFAVFGHIGLAGSRVNASLDALALHASAAQVGSIVTCFAFLPMFVALPMGRLIDRIGARRPMVCGVLLMLAGAQIPWWWPGIPALYASAVLIGSGFVPVYVGAQHLVGASAPPNARTAHFSWLAMGYSVSSFFGPVLAGFSVDHLGHQGSHLVFVGVLLCALALLAFPRWSDAPRIVRAPSATREPTFGLLADIRLRELFMIQVVLAAAWDLFMFLIPLRGVSLNLSASMIGTIIGMFAVGTFAVRLIMPQLSRRFSEWEILRTALVVGALAYACIPFAPGAPGLLLLAFVLGLAMGCSQPNMLSLLHSLAPPGRAGEAVGIRVTIGNMSQVFLPLSFGFVGAAFGVVPIFWVIAGALAGAVPLANRQAHRMRLLRA